MDHYLLQPGIKSLGHSGCRVELIERASKHTIIKTSSCLEYNDRLWRQIQKQKLFHNKYIKTPRVYSTQYVGSLLQVEMEFVNGLDFTRYLELSTINHLRGFGQLLINYIDDLINNAIMTDISEVCVEKVQNVRRIISNNKFTSSLVDVVPEPGEIVIPVGICHGDLTLSNIMWQASEVFAIDLLDSFIESPLIDIVKLRQDTFHKWSLDRSLVEFDRAKVSLALTFLDRAIVGYCHKYDWFLKNYEFFQKLNLCRVLQYVNNKQSADLLIEEIERVRI